MCAKYKSPGNYIGQYKQHVLPTVSKDVEEEEEEEDLEDVEGLLFDDETEKDEKKEEENLMWMFDDEEMTDDALYHDLVEDIEDVMWTT